MKFLSLLFKILICEKFIYYDEFLVLMRTFVQFADFLKSFITLIKFNLLK